MENTIHQHIPRYSIALVSAAALAYEILLMKIFSIVQWDHFAYMVISLALLGYGISGTFIVLFRDRLLSHFPLSFITNIVLFGITTISNFWLTQQIPFYAQEMLWNPDSILWLLAYFLLLTLPFFFAANTVGLALSFYKSHVARLYAADMIGAGLGSLIILILLFLFYPDSILQIISSVAFFAALLAFYELGMKSKKKLVLLLFVLLPFMLPDTVTQVNMSPYKNLSKVLQIKDTRIIEEYTSPLGVVTVVESPTIPFRHVPGLSINSDMEPLEQLGVFTNGEGMSVITRYPDSLQKLKYLDEQTSALPYHLKHPKDLLIIGVGGGSDLLQALYHKVEHIDAVELDGKLVDLVKDKYSQYAGDIYKRPNVTIHITEGRKYLSESKKKYDLIQLSLLDSYNAASAGLYALSENYLYTNEAFSQYLQHLAPGGYLTISRWIKLPPRDSLKLVATAVEALKQEGVENPQKSIIVIRGWQTSTLLIKNGVISEEEINSIKHFSEERNFDLVYYHGMQKSEANRYNILHEASFYRGIEGVLNEKDFFEKYKFDITPTSDERPYFYHFFKWDTLSEIYALRGSGGLYLMEWGYLILVISLILAVIISVVLILLPLISYRNIQTNQKKLGKSKVLVYFFTLGIAFLFLEITFMQRFILYLGHPIYSAAIVLSSFLVFAGLGGGYSKKLSRKRGDIWTVRSAIFFIIVLSLVYLLVFDMLFVQLIVLPDLIKMMITIALIAPLAFAMGIPFPIGLAYLAKKSPMFIPWAWGINSCASVISSILATLLAINFGFTVVTLLALFFYIFAFIIFMLM